MKPLEDKLDEIFVKQAPDLPPNVIKFIVQYLPWFNLFLGIWTLLTAYWLWNAAHVVNSLVNYANQVSAAYGGTKIATSNMTAVVWLGIAVLAIEAVIYIVAFAPTRARKKIGWDLLFYALLINVAYGIVKAFTPYGGFGDVFFGIIGTAIGLYFLFQIRASYLGKPAVAAAKAAKPADKPAKKKS